MMPRRVFAALALIAVPLAANAAQVDSTIRLRTRTFAPAAGLDTATMRLARTDPGGTLHVLVQFRGDQHTSVRDTLALSLGVRWLWPVTVTLGRHCGATGGAACGAGTSRWETRWPPYHELTSVLAV